MNTRSTIVGNVIIDVPQLDAMQYKVREAQKKLNMQIVADCEPLVPFSQGALRNSVRYPNGIYGDLIEYNTPYARYMYGGEKYGPNIPRFDGAGNLVGFWSPAHKHPTGQPLQYHTQGTGSHWFDKAKQQHGAEWKKLVADEITKG